MEDKTYNGWYNYATWRINLEIFDGMEIDEPWTWEQCRDYAEEVVTNFGDIPDNSLDVQYAMAFINDVAWAEIRDHVNENFENTVNYEGA